MNTDLKHILLYALPFLIAVALYLILIVLVPKYWPALPAAVGVPTIATSTPQAVPLVVTDLGTIHYIEVVDGCGVDYTGTCVNLRSGPGPEFPVVERLRTGVVLKVSSTVSKDGHDWYKIAPGNDIRYPERITSDWYVYADAVRLFSDTGDQSLPVGTVSTTTTKRIVVDVSKETLYAYDGDTLFMQEPISTGLEYTPTPNGTFTVYHKTPSRYMQGPLPGVSTQKYDLPGVPWDLYFTRDGAVIHGAYWHDHFGQPWSHGCVNLSPQNAKKLYYWADIGTPVTVQP